MFGPHIIDGIGLVTIIATSSPLPTTIKIQNPKLETAKIALASGSLIIAKDHDLAHDWREYSVDPVMLADEHADRIIVYSEYTGIKHWESFNEPIPHNQEVIDWLIAHELQLAKRLAPHGITVYVLGLSVGWPNESVGGKLWWSPFDWLFANWLPNMVLSVGEYFPTPNGPDEGWGYYAGRLIHMPNEVWKVIGKPYLRECGQDRVDEYGVHKFWGNTHGNIDLFVSHMFRFKELYEESGIEPIGASIFTCGTESADWIYTDYSRYLPQMQPLWEARYQPQMPPLFEDKLIRVKLPNGQTMEMEVEKYLKGVVPAELSGWKLRVPNDPNCLDIWEDPPDPAPCAYHTETTEYEALEAQARWSRSYAYYQIERNAGKPYHVDCTQSYQVYRPDYGHERSPAMQWLFDKSDEAIWATRGEVIVDKNGKVPLVQYIACCGLDEATCNYCRGEGGSWYEQEDGTMIQKWPGRACQFGAQSWAKAGKSSRWITLHYYRDKPWKITTMGYAPFSPPEEPQGDEDDGF